MIIEREKFITRSMVRQNRHKLFLFGDNTAHKGFGGQAKEMRGEVNAKGIPTKWIPSMNSAAFFKDSDFDIIKLSYDKIFRDIAHSGFNIVVIPADGIGTGLARLEKTAPIIFRYLQQCLHNLEHGKTKSYKAAK